VRYAALVWAFVVVIGAGPVDGHVVGCVSWTDTDSVGSLNDDLSEPLLGEWTPLIQSCPDRMQFSAFWIRNMTWTGTPAMPRGGSFPQRAGGVFHATPVPGLWLSGGSPARRVDFRNALAH
jgi:hypothetical protein